MKKLIFVGFFALSLLLGLFVYHYTRYHDGRLHIVFCNVGQGDAVLIRTPAGRDLLYDGGPDNAVLSCLSAHMPFWDRTLDSVLLSHPHADHLVGLIGVIDRYTTKSFQTENIRNETSTYLALQERLAEKKIQQRMLLAGDSIALTDGVKLQVHGPNREYLQQTSPGGMIGESAEFASLIIQLSYGSFDLLLTGDSQAEGLKKVAGRRGAIDVLQVPHHGSRTGLDSEVVKTLQPRLGVISVGKNSYGHPSKEILRLLSERGIHALRTDKKGDIEIISDGKIWWVKDSN